MNTKRQPRLLSLDDDAEIGKIIGAVAEKAGFDTAITESAETFSERMRDLDPDVAVLDLQMPDMDGIQLLRRLADMEAKCGIVLVTGVDRRTIASAEQYALKRGLNVMGTLQKPFQPEDLLRKLQSVKGLLHPLDAEDFEQAIENGQLCVHYQPVARYANGGWEIDSVEALLRWEHPERGTLLPGAFLRFGEDRDMSRRMTDFVINRGLEQIRGWQASSVALGLRVNLSAALITDVEFPDRLQTALEQFEINGASLTLEVNETAMLAEHPETFDILTRLRLKQIRLAIDDFGIGYSSLTQLFRMPFSEMKIDRSLVTRAPESEEARIGIEALVDLAHKLGLEVCGEGVESAEALDFLAGVDCDAAQGFFVSPPVAPREILRELARWAERARGAEVPTARSGAA
jgi:EAL domain-containing protein (putative c-di-GMP-specific phosphodiesterase class I)/FixJ family two-component response regulator